MSPRLTFILALALTALLLGHGAVLRDTPLSDIEWTHDETGERIHMATWRYWEDLKFAIGRQLDRTYGPSAALPPAETADAAAERAAAQLELTDAYRDVATRRAEREGIRPWQFWRTVPDVGFVRVRAPYVIPRFEDRGRSRLLAAGFRVLGGIAPYLQIWLAVLLCVPVWLWLVWEFQRAGQAIAALILLALCALSPYVVETLTLPHSAVGFYLLAIICLTTVAGYAVFGRVTRAGLVLRTLAAGCVFALCIVCRSGTVVLFPGFALALLVAERRLANARRAPATMLHRLLTFGLLACLLLAPYLVARPAERHGEWVSIWEGLGDLAPERGYSWHDRDAKRFLVRHGLPPFDHPNEVTREQELFFRAQVLGDVRRDPLWYTGVLGQRALATLSLSKLWPRRAADGRSLDPPVFHYKYTTTVDWIGFGERRFELPILVLVFPTILIAAACWRGATAQRARGYGGVLLCMLAGTLPLPVLVSTAAGLETEAVAIAYFLAAGFVVQELVLRIRGQRVRTAD